VNRKCPPRNTILQLSIPYTDPEPSGSPPPEFPNFFNNGLWLYQTSYSKDVGSSEYRKFVAAYIMVQPFSASEVIRHTRAIQIQLLLLLLLPRLLQSFSLGWPRWSRILQADFCSYTVLVQQRRVNKRAVRSAISATAIESILWCQDGIFASQSHGKSTSPASPPVKTN